MKAFIPLDVTDDMLVSSTITEPDAAEPAYNPATTYAEFAQVSVVSENSHLVYESLVAGNVGNPVTDKTKWILKGKTNRFRMFDWNQGNPSVAESPLMVVLQPGERIDAIALDGLKATLLEMTVTNGIDGEIVYTMDGYLLNSEVTSWYDYFFSRFYYAKTVSTFLVPPVKDPVIYLTLSDPSGFVELSRFAFGQSVYLGNVQYNPIVDYDNYSEIVWDNFGRATLTPVPSIPTIEQKILVDSSIVSTLRQFRDDANAKAVFWAALDDVNSYYAESLKIFGVYRSYQIEISNHNSALLNLSLKGI